jgi:(p)ppGpp synthase/HD superfamily hydrolase
MMTQQAFESYLEKHAGQIKAIREGAHELHRSVNQTYGDGLPYGYHLDMTAQGVMDFGYMVCASENDVLPMLFGAYYHDSIEDARLTYNDVLRLAQTTMTMQQALMATEIVYALTNDKGRTRAERAGERYYQGIRQTPYAPLVKLCDRLANVAFSCSGTDKANLHMKEVYKQEMHHFLTSIDSHSSDPRLKVPKELILRIAECLIDDMEREEQLIRSWLETGFA